MMRTRPTTSSSDPPPLLRLLPAYDSRKPATIRRTTPGTAERGTWVGGAGIPDRAVTIGTLVMERAGREAAKYVASTARPMAGPITTHGSWKVPITWWALDSTLGR